MAFLRKVKGVQRKELGRLTGTWSSPIEQTHSAQAATSEKLWGKNYLKGERNLIKSFFHYRPKKSNVSRSSLETDVISVIEVQVS